MPDTIREKKHHGNMEVNFTKSCKIHFSILEKDHNVTTKSKKVFFCQLDSVKP